MDFLSPRQNEKNTRNSSVELLRIIAILFIVLSHSSAHGGFLYDNSNYNNIILAWLSLGNLGVDIFVMITGYFSYKRVLKKDHFIKLLSQVYFYSILCFFIAFIFIKSFTLKELITVFFPTIFTEYWFFTAYFVLMLLSPYINMLIEKTSRKQFLHCIALMIIMWIIIPTFTTQNMYGSELPQFLMLYLFGAYFKKYPDNIFKNSIFRRVVTGLSFILLYTSSVVFYILGNMIPFFACKESFFFGRTSLLVIGCAVGLFSLAVYKKAYVNKFINIIGGCTFGVYLFHDNPFIRKLLWLEWLPNFKLYDSIYLPIALILSSVFVFIVCILIDYVRQRLFAGISFEIINYLYEHIKKIVWFLSEKAKYIYRLLLK